MPGADARAKWTVLVIFAAIACLLGAMGAGQTVGEKVSTLQNAATNQDHYNDEEHKRNEKSREELEVRLLDRFRVLDTEEKVQNANINALDHSATEIKFLGVLILFATPVALAIVRDWIQKKNKIAETDLIAHDAIRDKILSRITSLEQASVIINLQMPLMTELAQELTGMIVGAVHHPDDSHTKSDDLLDKVGGPEMTHADTHMLNVLMAERSVDIKVPHNEREMASRLPKMMALVKQLIALQTGRPATEISYGDRTAAKQEKADQEQASS